MAKTMTATSNVPHAMECAFYFGTLSVFNTLDEAQRLDEVSMTAVLDATWAECSKFFDDLEEHLRRVEG